MAKYVCPCVKQEILESTHVHDFRWCSCGEVAVDGGDEYSRRIGNEYGKFAELVEDTDES